MVECLHRVDEDEFDDLVIRLESENISRKASYHPSFPGQYGSHKEIQLLTELFTLHSSQLTIIKINITLFPEFFSKSIKMKN